MGLHSVTYCSHIHQCHSVQIYTTRSSIAPYTPIVRRLFSQPLVLTHVLSPYNPEPAGQIRAAEASVVKKPSIAGEMSVGMGIWRDNGGKCSDARELAKMSRLTCHLSHVSHLRANVFSNHVFGGV